MADDLDALFGAFDGADNDEVDVGLEPNESEHDDEGSDAHLNEVSKSGEEEIKESDGNPIEDTDPNRKRKELSPSPPSHKPIADPSEDVIDEKEEKGSGPSEDTISKNRDKNPSSPTLSITPSLAVPVIIENDTDTVAAEIDKAKEATTKMASISTGTSHDKSIRTYTAIPENKKYTPRPSSTDEESKPPAKTYPFELDPFQSTAISHIKNNESVLVAAHTSAGKTAVAEYAIAQSLRDGQRVVYTSPIKALSNQKYRDLQEEFSDVGLMTGDVTIDPGATCLVMTTEILRSMLYRGSELVREVAWVIFDEVHYMRDRERGVVWEESIILLPHRVRFVFLSATIPNADQFVRWIARVHRQPCHVVYTNYRPTPLQHYVFPAGGDGLHLVVDERGNFREDNFQKAMATLQGGGTTESAIAENMAASGNARGGGGNVKRRRKSGGPGQGGNTDLRRIVKLIMDRHLDPVIIFSFSKKDCERYALEISREDFTDEVEKELVTQVYKNAIDSLGEDDRKLPQVEALLPLLKRGIGIHHGGLLPILKEIVEILFSEGLIKALFATETFSIGINMPARTVVFTNTRKWDGVDFRWVTSGEYIQMSGRAGRRGKDDRGVVIQMMDEKMEPSVCKGILYGDPDPLDSSYKISYNMLLNTMRVEDVDPEHLLRASFYQFQKEGEVPVIEKRAALLEEEADAIVVSNENNGECETLVAEYCAMENQLLKAKTGMLSISRDSRYVLPFVQQPGRLMKIMLGEDDYGWGVLISHRKKMGEGAAGAAGKLARSATVPDHTIDVLLNCVDRRFDEKDSENAAAREEDKKDAGLLWRGTAKHCRPPQSDDETMLVTMRSFTVEFHDIVDMSAVRLFIPQDIQLGGARLNVSRALREVKRRFPDGVPVLDPIKDLKIHSKDYERLSSRKQTLSKHMSSHSLRNDFEEDKRSEMLASYRKKTKLKESGNTLREESRSLRGTVKRDELKKMKRILKGLGHVDSSGVIQTKGRAACEINAGDELVVVELVFGGAFNDLEPEQCVALLSCFSYDERKRDDDGDPTKGMKSYLSNPYRKLQDAIRAVAKATVECKIDLDEDEYLDKFNPGLMEAVFAWCKGAKFVEVQKLTETFEGTTIRCLRRLEELIRQLCNAAKAIGNHELQAKFEKGGELIKRDIVFCSSLYL